MKVKIGKKIIFFLDYDSTSGNGHLYRSLKFKKVFGSNSKIFFLCKKKIPTFIKGLNFCSENFNSFINKYKKKKFDFAVIDSYKINLEDEVQIKSISNKTIFIDDYAKRKTESDYVLNYSPYINKLKYKNLISKNTKLLLGIKYNFVQEMINRVDIKKRINERKKIILFFYFGVKNRTQILKEILNSIKNINIIKKVIVISKYRLRKTYDIKINYINTLSWKKFYLMMQKSDILFLSTGTIIYEALLLKKIIFSRNISFNQKQNYDFLIKKKSILPLKKFNSFINLSKDKILKIILDAEKKNPIYISKNSLNYIKKKIF